MNHTETNEDWEIEFDKKCPPVVSLLPLGYRESRVEKGETGVLFDIQNKEIENRALAYHENVKSFIRSIRQSDKELILGKMEEYFDKAYNYQNDVVTVKYALDTCKSIVEEVMK